MSNQKRYWKRYHYIWVRDTTDKQEGNKLLTRQGMQIAHREIHPLNHDVELLTKHNWVEISEDEYLAIRFTCGECQNA